MKYHPYGNIDPFIVPEAADKVLNEYFDVAEGLGVKTFLYYGSVLGFVRDGGYIPGCDHGVPFNISWPDFIHYARLLAELTGWL